MISSLATPGVYIKEVNGFPPSIAQVATAIPAFVGYTEYGIKDKPTKIQSLLEFENLFGGAPKPETLTIDLAVKKFEVVESKFKLYNSLRLFFVNGGGECYIVSIGKYDDNPDFTSETPFNNGITRLEKFDEPTLILFPDAINLGATILGLVQQHALKQCSELLDRFVIMDVIQSASDGTSLEADNASFRDAVGNRDLKYGAAYYPNLKTNYGYKFRLKQIEAGGVSFSTIYASDAEISAQLAEFEDLHVDINDPADGILKKMETPETSFPTVDISGTEANVEIYLQNIWNLLAVLGDPGADLTHTGLQTFVNTAIPVSLKPLAQKLVDFNLAYDSLDSTNPVDLSTVNASFTGAWGDISDTGPSGDYEESSPNPFTGNINDTVTPTDPDFSKIQAFLNRIHEDAMNTMKFVIDSIKDYELKTENDLTLGLPIYPAIIAGLSATINTVPPSGAIAGIYAYVDANRGVWKAPGNVSVSGIIGLTDDINHKEQMKMNVHETGKSINAIRTFTGRGKLVWGARTLDGNSNDWRYINVRRLANMIEESTKKACMNFVFEPNVKQTWVNVKGMISNYLTTLWGDGALAGAKPEDAFFVSVGLNETMTSDDITNGRMIVKIGCALVRPAEFIVLEFTQTQQRS